MKISTSFDSVANDLLIDFCEMCICEAELDGILFIEAMHSNIHESSDEGHLTVTYYTSFPEDALGHKYGAGYKWTTYKEALSEKFPEVDVIRRVAESKSIAPGHFLSSEKATYTKALPLSVIEVANR